MASIKKTVNIEKYDFDEFEKEEKPFTMILTQVIQNATKNPKETYLWIYLQSLPVTWIPNKKHLMQVFDLSERTYERYMSWLNAVSLIEYRQDRDENGHFGKWRLVVLNGTKFNPTAVSSRSAKIGGTVMDRSKKVQSAHAHRSANLPLNGEPVATANGGHIKTTPKIDNKKNKKTKQDSVFVFSCSEEIETCLEDRASKKNLHLSDDLKDQVLFWIEKDVQKENISKCINGALKKISEGKWNIPHGYKGITSQSIKKNDDEQQRQKEDETKYDALVGEGLYETLKNARTEEECQIGRKKCESLFEMLGSKHVNHSAM
jgi:hypothetical protein